MTTVNVAPIEVAFGVATDTGLRRKLNEDSYLAAYPLFLVADGMGGYEGGEIASAIAIEEFGRLSGRPSVGAVELQQIFDEASGRIRTLPEGGGAGAGTTISGVAVSEHDGGAYWLMINLGDSRTYRLSGDVLEQISVDHSLVQELVESGEISAAAAASDPRRNVVTRAIGAGSIGQPDYWLIPAEVSDRILICSDGLTGELDEQRIGVILREETDPQAAATRLVHEALLHGGRDNVTVVVVDALAIEGSDDSDTVPVGADLDDLERTIPRTLTDLAEGDLS